MTFFARFHQETELDKLLAQGSEAPLADVLAQPQLLQELHGGSAKALSYVAGHMNELVDAVLAPAAVPEADLATATAATAVLSSGVRSVLAALVDGPGLARLSALFSAAPAAESAADPEATFLVLPHSPHPVVAGYVSSILVHAVCKTRSPEVVATVRTAVAGAMCWLHLDGAVALIQGLVGMLRADGGGAADTTGGLPGVEDEAPHALREWQTTVASMLLDADVPASLVRVGLAREPRLDGLPSWVGSQASIGALMAFEALCDAAAPPVPRTAGPVPDADLPPLNLIAAIFASPELAALIVAALLETPRAPESRLREASVIVEVAMCVLTLWAIRASPQTYAATALPAFAALTKAVDEHAVVDAAVDAFRNASVGSDLVLQAGPVPNPLGEGRLALARALVAMSRADLSSADAAVPALLDIAFADYPWNNIFHNVVVGWTSELAVRKPEVLRSSEVVDALARAVAALPPGSSSAHQATRPQHAAHINLALRHLRKAFGDAPFGNEGLESYESGELAAALALNDSTSCPVSPELAARRGVLQAQQGGELDALGELGGAAGTSSASVSAAAAAAAAAGTGETATAELVGDSSEPVANEDPAAASAVPFDADFAAAFGASTSAVEAASRGSTSSAAAPVAFEADFAAAFGPSS
ncbi:uncharacterized protein AMSG_04162 [Thecamonas trahens ATCC 50062]|uniref:Uncharacterized protein n=1 Tax=Thecamonas trahens ATCC 50062 TaxID=461836 RepID=A0A0L0D6B2_THETB|nr:hypothetical protein AMSG_04162 [Thecamonas trahens ATCC 50062]KNC47927.1 hypothetical protein AMSG_04162 [Thecamonas trahens ATCC 50062]|eukprot:XP_013758946.1 hypothetical protein AMSG_04162 [Thecamonas trahens ATCC 50062]